MLQSMFRFCMFFCSAVFLFILSSCGGDSSDGGSNESGSIDYDQAEIIAKCDQFSDGYYGSWDEGFSNGVRLKPGQMPSDVDFSIMNPCAPGEFIYNGKCWGSLKYDMESFTLTAESGGIQATLFEPGAAFDSERQSQLASILSGSQTCDPAGAEPPNECNIYGHYGGELNTSTSGYAPTPTASLNWVKEADGSLRYPFLYEEPSSQVISLRMNFGLCGFGNGFDMYADSVYRWFYKGTIVLKGKEYPNPVTVAQLKEIYGRSLVPINEDTYEEGCELTDFCYLLMLDEGSRTALIAVENGSFATDDAYIYRIMLPAE